MGETCSRLVLVVVLWSLNGCPQSSAAFIFNKSRPRALVELKTNAKRENGAYYIEANTDLTLTCMFTEYYKNPHNSLNIYVRMYHKSENDTKNKYHNSLSTMLPNDSAKLTTFKNIPFEAGSHPGLRVQCCAQEVEYCTGEVETIYTIRELIPINFTSADCIVDNFTLMKCQWQPSINEQKEHTGMTAEHPKLKVQQFLCWNRRINDTFLPPGYDASDDVESCGTWKKSSVDEGSGHTWGVSSGFVMGAIYDIEVHVTDFFDNKKSQDVVVNTTQKVQISSVSGLAVIVVSAKKLQVNWILPTLPQQHRQVLDVCLQYQSEWDTLSWDHLNLTSSKNDSETSRDNHILTELTPFTNYTCRVRVKTHWSEVWSEPSIGQNRTSSDKPEQNPDYLPVGFFLSPKNTSCTNKCLTVAESCGQVPCDSLTVFWKPLAQKFFHCPEADFGYLVQYRLRPVSSFGHYLDWINKTMDSSKDFHWTTPLSRDTDLQVRILSKNSMGTASDKGSVVMDISTQDYLGMSDIEIESDNFNSTVNISWRSPSPKQYSFWLVWCATDDKIYLHNCSSPVQWMNRTNNVTVSDTGLHQISVSTEDLRVKRTKRSTTNQQYTNSHKYRSIRTRRMSGGGDILSLSKLLLGVVAERKAAGETTKGSQGIIWPDFYYVNTKGPGEVTKFNLASDGHGDMLVSWSFSCRDICSKPVRFQVLYRKNGSSEWQSQDVAVTERQCVIEDLEGGATYLVKLVLHTVNNPSRPTNIEMLTIKGPLLGGAAIAGIVVGCLFIIGLVSACLIRKCYKLRKQWYGMNIQLPGDMDTRRSSSEPGRHYSSQLSDDSRTGLLLSTGLPRQQHHHNNGDLLPHAEEEDDNVFAADGHPTFSIPHYPHSNGQTNEVIPLTPIIVTETQGGKMVDLVGFKVSDFPAIESEYLHPVLKKPESVENLEDYCRVCVTSARGPVEGDDRSGNTDYYPRESCSCKGMTSSSATQLHKLETEEWTQPPESHQKPSFVQPAFVHLPTKKQPTEDYWKDSSSAGSSHSTEKPLVNKRLGQQVDWGKGVSDPFLNHKDLDKKTRKMNAEIVDNKGSVETVGLENLPALWNKNKVAASKSHSCISNIMVQNQPNGYVSISEGSSLGGHVKKNIANDDVGKGLSRKEEEDGDKGGKLQVGHHHKNTAGNDTTSATKGYLSLEELHSLTVPQPNENKPPPRRQQNEAKPEVHTPVNGLIANTLEPPGSASQKSATDKPVCGNRVNLTPTGCDTPPKTATSKKSPGKFEIFDIPTPKYNVENPRKLFDNEDDSIETKRSLPQLPPDYKDARSALQTQVDDKEDHVGRALLESVAATTRALKESLQRSNQEGPTMEQKKSPPQMPLPTSCKQTLAYKAGNDQIDNGSSVRDKSNNTCKHIDQDDDQTPVKTDPDYKSNRNPPLPPSESSHHLGLPIATPDDKPLRTTSLPHNDPTVDRSSHDDSNGSAVTCPPHLRPRFKDFVMDPYSLASSSVAIGDPDETIDTVSESGDGGASSTPYCHTDLRVDLNEPSTPPEDHSLGQEMTAPCTPLLEEDVLHLIDSLERRDGVNRSGIDKYRIDSEEGEEDESLSYCTTNLKKEAAVVGQVRKNSSSNAEANRRSSEDEDRFYVSTALSYNVT